MKTIEDEFREGHDFYVKALGLTPASELAGKGEGGAVLVAGALLEFSLRGISINDGQDLLHEAVFTLRDVDSWVWVRMTAPPRIAWRLGDVLVVRGRVQVNAFAPPLNPSSSDVTVIAEDVRPLDRVLWETPRQ